MSSSAYYTPLDVDDEPKARRPPSKHFTRQRTILLGGLITCFVVVTAMLAFGPSEATVTDALSRLTTARCPSHCPSDPFVKAGMLHFGPYPNDTRWLPFPHEPIDALENPLDSEKAIDYSNVASQDAFDVASPPYMKMLSEGSGDIEWVRNKTVLFIGSSHDRNNVDYFCSYVGAKYTNLGGHKFGYCKIPEYNLTIVNWFLYGMVDGEFDWFAKTEERPHPFEGRIDKFMLPMMAQYDLKAPNLIIETSLFWDDNFLQARALHYGQKQTREPLTYSEMIWHRSRVHALIARTREIYGLDVPIMFRTRHFRKDNGWNHILRIFQLDQSIRAIAEELGIKLFVWGGRLEGQTTQFYDGDQHFQKGPVTWLFGDMMLFYLKRATTTGCWRCHQWRD